MAKKTPNKKTAGKKKKATRRRSKQASGGRLVSVLKWALVAVFVSTTAAVVGLDYWVQQKFEGKRWQMPAHVYARPLELFAGACISPHSLQVELRALGYRIGSKLSGKGSAVFDNDHIQVHTRGFSFPDGIEQSRLVDISFESGCVSRMSIAGEALPILRLEPLDVGSVYRGEYEDRVLVKLDAVPRPLIDALVAVEDKDFYGHWGISFKGIARAIWVNWKAGTYIQGGSTITQQLVKNFYLSGERSLWRKAVEAAMAILLELHYSKDEILETYLNEIYLGQSGSKAIHGVGLASQFYFGRDLKTLDLHESALLVALIKGPSYYNPRRHPSRAIKRRNTVLESMTADNAITVTQESKAKNQSLNVIKKPRYHNDRFPAYLDLVKRQLQRDYSEQQLQSEGLRIFTTLDPLVQLQAEESLKIKTAQLQKAKVSAERQLQGAVIVTHVETGELLAVVGDVDADYAGFNRALDAYRPVGSLLKPAVVLTALMDDSYSLATVIQDEPFSIQARDGDTWSPKNFDDESHGDVLLVDALVYSYNQALAKLGLELGTDKVIRTLRAFGVTKRMADLPSLLLGAVDMSPLQVTEMYQTIAANGFHMPLRTIRDVMDHEGNSLSRYPLQVEQVLPADKMYLLQYGMQQVMQRGTGRSAYYHLPDSSMVAGKTGTSNDLRDSWFVGYSGNLLATVWLGHDDNSITELTGATGALQVWSQFMKQQALTPLVLNSPADAELHWIDSGNGGLVASGCDAAVEVAFLAMTEPKHISKCEGQQDIIATPKDSKGVMGWLKGWFN